MKITVEQEKPVFKPITITLETAQEYFELLGVLGECRRSVVEAGLEYYGLKDTFNLDKLMHEQLYNLLGKYQRQVKETL